MTGDRYTLYYDRKTSAFAPHVMLEELGVDYDLRHVDNAVDTDELADYEVVNPNFQLPAIRPPDGRIFPDSLVTPLILGDRHPERGLVPPPEDPDRKFVEGWLYTLATTGGTLIHHYVYSDEHSTLSNNTPKTGVTTWSQINRFMTIVDDAISGDPWFMARGFGVLDILLYVQLLYLAPEQRASLYTNRPRLARLHAAAHERESIERLWRFYFED